MVRHKERHSSLPQPQPSYQESRNIGLDILQNVAPHPGSGFPSVVAPSELGIRNVRGPNPGNIRSPNIDTRARERQSSPQSVSHSLANLCHPQDQDQPINLAATLYQSNTQAPVNSSESDGLNEPRQLPFTLPAGSVSSGTLLQDLGNQNNDVDLNYEPPMREAFATWLFDSDGALGDIDFNNFTFTNPGLDTAFSNNRTYTTDGDSLPDWSHNLEIQLDEGSKSSENGISDFTRQELLQLIHGFRQKQKQKQKQRQKRHGASRGPSMLENDLDDDAQFLNTTMLQTCISAFWEHIAPQIPILHHPTFSPDTCPILLLAAVIALGVSTLNRLKAEKTEKYAAFADLIALHLRWELFTDEDAQPPAKLWVFQALLLLELYEKMYSSRQLHERAHIHHASTLTLLKRGSPLIGKDGTKTPSLDQPSACDDSTSVNQLSDANSYAWWSQWVRIESMHRVVFSAFILDITHAVMFAHSANMEPHEIHLDLPCDEALWSATTPHAVQSLDESLRMYGVRPISFLDGLKRSLHRQHVKTHEFGRVILISGLLSIGWHMSHRESELTWLETPSRIKEQKDWRALLFRAFDSWNTNFEEALGTANPSRGVPVKDGGLTASLDSRAVLFHLAHMSLNVDIIECQIFAGSKRLLGRQISSSDHATATIRMKSWAPTSQARHAVLHAFKFLHRLLVRPVPQSIGTNRPDTTLLHYSCRQDHLNYRPWIIYFSTLTIWAYNHALDTPQRKMSHDSSSNRSRYVTDYLSRFAAVEDPEDLRSITPGDGCATFLEVVSDCLAEADSEILLEASNRLKACRELLQKM